LARDNGHGDARIIQGVGLVAGPSDELPSLLLRKQKIFKARYLRMIDEQIAITKDKLLQLLLRKKLKKILKVLRM